MVDETGGMLNDPVAVKLAEDRYWISIADSDLLYWVKGIAWAMRLEVLVDEPDVHPLAVQGPRADDVMAGVFGDAVRDIRFFRFGLFAFQGRWLAVTRSGYSRQGGFEIYLEGANMGMYLWHALMETGKPHDIRAGCPNLFERIDGRLLSYGNDMTRENTPHECGLGRFCNTMTAIGCVGRDALLRVAREGPTRQIRALAIEGAAVPPCLDAWKLTDGKGRPVGQITSAAFSPDFGTNVALGMVRMTHWEPGTPLTMHAPNGKRSAELQAGFFHERAAGARAGVDGATPARQ